MIYGQALMIYQQDFPHLQYNKPFPLIIHLVDRTLIASGYHLPSSTSLKVDELANAGMTELPTIAADIVVARNFFTTEIRSS